MEDNTHELILNIQKNISALSNQIKIRTDELLKNLTEEDAQQLKDLLESPDYKAKAEEAVNNILKFNKQP